MMNDKQAADEAKDTANALLKQGRLEEAVEMYTRAIGMCDRVPAYYTNRALAHTKLENYGYAIADADKAIDIDPSFVKGYYRKAVALMALGKFRDARKQFRVVIARVPGDQDAKKQLDACEKMIRKIDFEKAIETDEAHVSAFSNLELDTIVVEDAYDGYRMVNDAVTEEFVDDMIARFREQKKIHRRYAIAILSRAAELFKAQPSLIQVAVPKGTTLTICGDVHGQYYDLMHLFELAGKPSEQHAFLFNGDFVDRGSFSVECILLLLAYKCLYPNGFFLARGNHETKEMNRMYGFEGETKAKYSESLFRMFTEVFDSMPIAHVIGEKILVVHGGLPADPNVSLDDIANIDRFRQPGSEGLMCELLWADPHFLDGITPSKRGVAHQFGPDITRKFLERNKLDMVIRSHEVKENGYVVEHDGKCVTIFSAPNYCDQVGNKGAFINVDADLKLEYQTFEAVPHPNVRPMQYASSMLPGLGHY